MSRGHIDSCPVDKLVHFGKDFALGQSYLCVLNSVQALRDQGDIR